MKTFPLLLLSCLLAAGAFAQELSWAELARRPEFWPSHCTVNRAFKFGNGSVAAGQKLEIVSLRAGQIELATADGLAFNAKPEETNALELARASWSQLTPAQRELTYASLLQKRDLWPYRVKLAQPARFNTGELKPGEAVILTGVEGQDLLLLAEKLKVLFTMPVRDTDLLAQARAALAQPGSAKGRIAEELQGKLIHPVTGAAAPLAGQPAYFVFYRGASWCGPCRQFSPSLVKFFEENKAKYPDVEFIYVSGDKTPAEMRGYAQEARFSWRTLPGNRHAELHVINPLFTQFIPQLVVTDRQGTVLIDSAKITTANALRQLDALLKKRSG